MEEIGLDCLLRLDFGLTCFIVLLLYFANLIDETMPPV
jgi:hypothetical protein